MPDSGEQVAQACGNACSTSVIWRTRPSRIESAQVISVSRFGAVVRKPAFILTVVLPFALIAEFVILEAGPGLSLPSDRGSATSTYEVREKGTETHYITRNKRFSFVDLWSNKGATVEGLVLRESFVMDRQEGVEGAKSMGKVEALSRNKTVWSLEEPGERGEPIDQVYEVTKYGCCAAPNTHSYFSLRTGEKLRTTHNELNPDELAALEKTLHD